MKLIAMPSTAGILHSLDTKLNIVTRKEEGKVKVEQKNRLSKRMASEETEDKGDEIGGEM